MYLGCPALPISIDLDKAKKSLEKAFKARNWKSSSIEEAKLYFAPYYFFEYNTYAERERKGEKVVAKVERGTLVLDPETIELVQGIAGQLPAEEQMLHEIPEKQEFELKKTKLGQDEAEKICQLKAAERLEMPLEKVRVTNVKLFYVPSWKAKARFDGQSLLLHVSAVNGAILEEKSIPLREKSAGEITRETLQELKEPKAWIQYAKGLLQLIAGGSKGHDKASGRNKLLEVLWRNKAWTITVALIIILLAVVFLL